MTRRRSIGEQFARRRETVVDGRYSRFVGLMKVALPVSAAALAVLVVAWPYLSGRDVGFNLTFADVGAGAIDAVHMSNARLFGTDDEGQPFKVTAESAIQDVDDSDTVRFTSPKADILLDNGAWLALTAAHGVLYRARQILVLDGAVELFFDEGYAFRTDRAEIDLRTRITHGDSPVEGHGPLGVLNADGFRFDPQGRTIRFEGRVRLVVNPRAGV